MTLTTLRRTVSALDAAGIQDAFSISAGTDGVEVHVESVDFLRVVPGLAVLNVRHPRATDDYPYYWQVRAALSDGGPILIGCLRKHELAELGINTDAETVTP